MTTKSSHEMSSKEIVQAFFKNGMSEDYLTDDFVWRVPPSLVYGDHGDFTRDGLAAQIHGIHDQIYDVATMDTTVDFMIAEGEWVAYQFEVKAKNKVGDDYHNFYCLTFRCRDGKIAEIREHVDSMLSKEVLFDPAGL